LIKTPIPPTFLSEWFLKSLNPFILNDVATARFTTEEEEIFKAKQLDLIYARFGLLYHILPNTSLSIYDPRQNLRPHVDGIVGTTNVGSTNLVTSHLKELSLNQSIGGPNSSMFSNPTQSMDVLYVKSSSNPNGNQQPSGNKNKGCYNNRKGGGIIINPRTMVIMRGRMIMLVRERNKGVRDCKLCTYDHITHLCPKKMQGSYLYHSSC
jgi:hypothetical protein